MNQSYKNGKKSLILRLTLPKMNKFSDPKVSLLLNIAGRRYLGSASSADQQPQSENSTKKLNQESESLPSRHSMSYSSAILNSVNATTNTLLQEYQKYYSYIWTEISSRLPSTSSPQSSTLRRLDLHEIIKPLIDMTTSAAPTPPPNKKPTPPSISIIRSQTESKLNNETRLVELVDSLQRASSLFIKSELIADLFKLLYAAPELRFTVHRQQLPLVKLLVQVKQLNEHYALRRKEDKRLTGMVNQCLSLLGHFDESDIKHTGVNILSLDGGGAKGFVTIEILKNIERHCGKPIHQIFDYIIGTSTGACIAALIAIYKLSLEEIERQYKIFVKEIFQQNRAAGIGNLVMSYSYYDTKVWEKMLKEAMGDTLVINSAKESNSCKISIVGNMTTANQMKIFLFRNYNLPPDSQSQYEGTSRYKVWEAVRASTAAPIYHEDFKIDGYVFYDGGVLANNPTAIALHEARHLWPKQKQPNCVVSVGNGRYQPVFETMSTSASSQTASNPSVSTSSTSIDLSLRQKVNRIVAGVSSTETVHNMLIDLLPHSVYYRFNPYLSEEFSLDENRPNKWRLMQYETSMYMRRNKSKFEMAAKRLCTEKSHWQKLEGAVRKRLR